MFKAMVFLFLLGMLLISIGLAFEWIGFLVWGVVALVGSVAAGTFVGVGS